MLALLPGADVDSREGVAGLRERLIVLSSPSKCFNIATLNFAYAVIPDAKLRGAFRAAGADMAEVPRFGYFGALAAYGHPESEAWRQRLLAYLLSNRDYCVQVLGAVPGLRCTRPESSYLLWVDASGLLSPGTDAARLLLQHGVAVNQGPSFGAAPTCFRLNFACHRPVLERGLERVVMALTSSAR